VTIALIGPMGAGKSSIGRRLAKALDARFTDTDVVIAGRHGPIPELFTVGGERAFRRLERAVVAEALAADGVVALGGGAVLDLDTQRDLKRCTVVLLTVSEEAVAARIAGSRRPLLSDGIESWRRIRDERATLYAALADVTEDTSRRPITALAAELAERLRPVVAR
jgi:shikimate kinase